MDEDIYPGDWDDDEGAAPEEDELDNLIEQLEELITGHALFDDMVDAALDWMDGEGTLKAVEGYFQSLDVVLAQELMPELSQEDLEEETGAEPEAPVVLPETLEPLQRSLQLMHRSLEEGNKVLMCLAILDMAGEVAEKRPETLPEELEEEIP